MKREILFRGKRVDDNEWIYGDVIQDGSDYFILPKTSGWFELKESLKKIISETIGQFTGLTDKNGVKIFENDKVFLRGHECIVSYRKNYCDFTFEKIKYGGRSLNVTKSNITKYDLEIIGNIYDA